MDDETIPNERLTLSSDTLLSLSFKLFDIRPIFEGVKDGAPGVPQRCTKGHQWNVGFSLIGISLDFSQIGFTTGNIDYCLLCLLQLLEDHCGKVEPGKPGQAEVPPPPLR